MIEFFQLACRVFFKLPKRGVSNDIILFKVTRNSRKFNSEMTEIV